MQIVDGGTWPCPTSGVAGWPEVAAVAVTSASAWSNNRRNRRIRLARPGHSPDRVFRTGGGGGLVAQQVPEVG